MLRLILSICKGRNGDDRSGRSSGVAEFSGWDIG